MLPRKWKEPTPGRWELCQQVGETPQLFPVLWDCGCFILCGRSYRRRVSWGSSSQPGPERARLRAPLGGPPALGYTLFCLGELPSARAHLEQGIALYDPPAAPLRLRLSARDMDSWEWQLPYSYAALTLWYLGYPDQALKRSHEALTLAQELSHPFSLAFALGIAAVVHQSPPGGAASPRAGRGADYLSTEQGFPYWLAWATILQGWALAEQGQEEEGIAQMRQGLATYQATGAEM